MLPLYKKIIVLAPYTHNHIHSDKSVRKDLFDLFHLVAEHVVSYRRFIRLSTASLPDCSGIWKWEQNDVIRPQNL